MKLTDHPSTYNDLTNFKSEVHTRTGKGRLCESTEKSHRVNLFSADFKPIETTVCRSERSGVREVRELS